MDHFEVLAKRFSVFDLLTVEPIFRTIFQAEHSSILRSDFGHVDSKKHDYIRRTFQSQATGSWFRPKSGFLIARIWSFMLLGKLYESQIGKISLILSPLSFVCVFALSPFLRKPLSILIYMTLPLLAVCSVYGSAILSYYDYLSQTSALYYCVMLWMALGTRVSGQSDETLIQNLSGRNLLSHIVFCWTELFFRLQSRRNNWCNVHGNNVDK